MSVTIRTHEMKALRKMLEHEHFSYGSEGLAALSAYRKIEAAIEANEELTSAPRAPAQAGAAELAQKNVDRVGDAG
jgi:hypothetical protein